MTGEPGTLQVLAMGVDTLVFSALGELRADIVGDLERWRDQAKVEHDRRARVTLPRSGTPILAKDHGARGYSYVLTSGDMDVTACSGKDFPPLRVELPSSFLHSMTPALAVARVVEILTKDFFGRESELLASRVDLYAGFQVGICSRETCGGSSRPRRFGRALRVGRAPGPTSERLPVRQVGVGGSCL